MDSDTTTEVAQTKEVSLINETDFQEKSNEDNVPESETKDDVVIEEGGHEDKSDGDAGAAAANDTEKPVATEGEEVAASNREGTSPQTEKDTEASEEVKVDKESDSQKSQSESETEKVPLDVESTEEKNEETQTKVRFNVSRESTEAAEESKVDPTATATDTEQGISTPTKQPMPSTESERGKEPVWYSRNSLLITSVFSILCFFPMGVIALYYGIKVKDTYHSKREAAKIKDYARKSTFCSIAAITTGITALLLILLVIILGITGVVE